MERVFDRITDLRTYFVLLDPPPSGTRATAAEEFLVAASGERLARGCWIIESGFTSEGLTRFMRSILGEAYEITVTGTTVKGIISAFSTPHRQQAAHPPHAVATKNRS